MMLRRNLFRMVAPLALLVSAQSAVAATLLVTKTAFCGCCKAWVERMKAAGFTVVVKDVDNVTPTARKLGVPDDLRSCHTSQIGGYAIEGHVPAEDIKRLLAEHPKAAGLAVPGMVMGTEGMEHGDHSMPYEVILFDRAGKTRVFAVH
jgi:hypothetical protein